MVPFCVRQSAAKAAFVPLLLICSATVAGCGRSDIADVNGSVTYQGKRLTHGRVVFYPEMGRPAFGDIGADGGFQLTTRDARDGALVGRHRVTIHCDQASDVADAFSDRMSLLPTRYQRPETSGLMAQVVPGKNTFHFELTAQR